MMHAPTPDMLRLLERTLHEEIPLTRAMGVTVERCDAHGLVLRAPLAPNLNHKQTAFGGSLATLTTLAGWGLLHLLLHERAPVTVVIQESRAHYLLPVEHDLVAVCPLPAAAPLEKFRRTLARRGMARIELEAFIMAGEATAVRFSGWYVAFDKAHYPDVEPV